MAQYRDFEYRQEDSTRRMNARLFGIIAAGRYRGFTAGAFGANMNLSLVHTVNPLRYPVGNSFVDNVGLVVSKQGVIVKETEPIVLGIAPNTTASPRRDLIVMTHTIVDVENGQPATYSVIQGTAGALAPVPALTDADHQVILGTLLIPANSTVLNGGGVEYVPAEVPFFAEDATQFQALLDAIEATNVAITLLGLNDLTDVNIPATGVGHALMFSGSAWTSINLVNYIQQQMLVMSKRIEQAHSLKTEAGLEKATVALPGATFPATQWHLNNGDVEHGNAIFVDSTDEAQWPNPAPTDYYKVHSITSGANFGTRLDFCFVAGGPVCEFVIRAGQAYLGTGIISGSTILPQIIKKGMTTGQVFTPVVGVTYGLLRRPDGWEILEYA